MHCDAETLLGDRWIVTKVTHEIGRQAEQLATDGGSMSGDYRKAGVEPCLDEILADPIVRLILRRDGIGITDLVEFLDQVRAKQARGADAGLGAPSGVSGAAL